MRHAVVVAPPRFVVPAQGNASVVTGPLGRVAGVLSRGGHHVVQVATTAELEADFDRALAGVGSADELLVFVAGRTTTATDAVALRTDDDRAAMLALRVMSDTVLVREPASVLFVIEACHDGDASDAFLAASHVDAIVQALDARSRG
jgi:hypothetical protein